MIVFRKGTTPTIALILPPNCDSSEIKVAWVTISQDDEIVLDKTTEDVTIEDGVVLLTLSQEDTLALAKGLAEMQLKVLTATGMVEASQISSVRVLDSLKNEVMTDEQTE